MAAPHVLAAQPDDAFDAFSKAVPAIRATGAGEVVVGPDLQSTAEAVTLDPGVAPLLLSLPAESEVRLGDWPIAPEVRADVVLQRHEIYEPKARIFKTVGQRLVEVPRSRLVFYWGEAETDGDVRVFVSVDPESGEIHGFSQSLDGTQELRPQPVTPAANNEAPRYLVAPLEAFEAQDKAANPSGASGGRGWSCGEEALPENLAQVTAPSWLGKSTSDKVLSSLHSAVIAVDTDNEFMLTKFSNNTTTATNYIANLIAKMNVFYERDLKVRLLQGTTILRVSTTADPYNQAAATNADGNKLNEFSNYWNATYGSVIRALSMMLSGKQPGGGASGIAWLNGLCSKSVGYSFSQVFNSAGDTSSSDAGLVGHELGHNFGSPHTHCYNPPIDTCYSGEGGCYSGATSCPAATTITNNGVPVTNVKGSIMSYCHLLGGCSASNVFHPRTISEKIGPRLDSALNICILPVVTSPTVAAITPNNGSTAGGTPVTITGANFVAGATVTIGGVAATGVNVINATTITATTGAHATGTVSIAVTNPDTQSGSLTNGFFYSPPPTATNFYTVTPCRVVDTRNANGPQGGPVLAASAIRTFQVTGICGIPASAKAISANVTIVTPAALGFLSLFPGNGIPVGTSSINFSPGQVRANNAVLLLATNGGGSIGVQNGSAGATHFLLDVNGYFQ